MFKLLKIKFRDDIKIERFCELAVPLYREYYIPLIGEIGAGELLNFLKPEIIKKEIKNNLYEYYLIEYDNKYTGVLILQIQEEILHISKIFILKRYRKKGIFRQIIEKLKSTLKERNLKKLKICIERNSKKLPYIISKFDFKKEKQIARYLGNKIYLYEDIYIYY